MKNLEKITSRRESLLYAQRHHFARIAMMEAEERGEDLSYEEAIELTKYQKS